jgi:glyoxylase-like metal-dependent hydrolase (beta-lactamase superfamily II)
LYVAVDEPKCVPFEDLYTSVFLIKTEKENILVDCATTNNDVKEFIIPALKKENLTLKDINYLVLTHSHGDHAGGKNAIVKENPNVKIIKDQAFFDGLEIYKMPGHLLECIGVLDLIDGTLISGDGLQGKGVSRYPCYLESKEEYIKTIEKIKNDKRINGLLFSHAYMPWYKDSAKGRAQVEKCLQDCIKEINYESDRNQ